MRREGCATGRRSGRRHVAVTLRNLPDAVRRSSGALISAGALHYIVALFAVQGLSYATQFAMARVTGPADFATIRTVEGVLNVLLVFASLGMPMLAVTKIAALPDPAVQGRLIGVLLLICGAASVAVAGAAVVGAGALGEPAGRYLRVLAFIMVFTAGSRTCLNYFQGQQRIQEVAGYSVALSAASFAIILLAVSRLGLNGWVLGRYLSEALFCGMMVRAIGPSLRWSGPVPGPDRLGGLVAAGTGVALSLITRTASDNAGLFILNAVNTDRVRIGYYGFSSLVLVAILIVPGAIPSIALPRFVARLDDRDAVVRLVRRVLSGSLLAGGALAVAAAVLAQPLTRLLLPSYTPALPLLNVLLIAVPFRLLSSMSGMVLVACGRVRYTVYINVVVLVVLAVVGFIVTERFSSLGTAAAVVGAEVCSAVAYTACAGLVLRRRLATGTPPAPLAPTGDGR
jgi:O-antigen/teichoic acid export membrane protein